jgi:hypothetical protein
MRHTVRFVLGLILAMARSFYFPTFEVGCAAILMACKGAVFSVATLLSLQRSMQIRRQLFNPILSWGVVRPAKKESQLGRSWIGSFRG